MGLARCGQSFIKPFLIIEARQTEEDLRRPFRMSVQKKTPDETLAEIDQIMNEIEELQHDMDAAEAPVDKKVTATAKPALKAVPRDMTPDVASTNVEEAEDHMSEFRSEGDSPSMEETLGDLKEDESAGPNLIDQAIGQSDSDVEVEEEESMNSEGMVSESPMDASVSIALSGTMTLKLSYDFGGQEVTIGFVDGALRVELSDGTEFKIPMNRSGELRKTA